jgi:hypothetical protein
VKSVVPSSIVALALISGCASVAPSKPSSQSTIEAKFAAVNRHALDEIVNLYSPEAQITASDFCQPRHGREDVRRTYKALFDAIPNIGVEVHEYVVQGDRVAVRLRLAASEDRVCEIPVLTESKCGQNCADSVCTIARGTCQGVCGAFSAPLVPPREAPGSQKRPLRSHERSEAQGLLFRRVVSIFAIRE